MLTFVGHKWGQWRSQTGADRRRPKASKQDIYGMFPVYLGATVTANQHQKPFPDLRSSLASSPSSSKSQSAFSYRYGASRVSHTTSLSPPASLTSRRKCGRSVNPSIPFPLSNNSHPFSAKTIDWCYIFYALAYQLSAIFLATTPRWYLYQALGSNLLWVLPWAITVSKININVNNAWKYHSIIFGGSLVFDFFVVIPVLGVWGWRLMRGEIRTQPVRGRV
jgi:hypothetical protein